jgi:dipeptidyl aminopeptidase/acylaminoacyl peptidase
MQFRFLNKYKYQIIILGIIIFHPLFSFAAGIDYGSILSQSTDSFVLKYGNMGDEDYYTCSVGSLSCSDNGKTAPKLPAEQTISAVPRFAFSTSSIFKNNIHIRNFYLTDSKTGKTYTRTYQLKSWDTLGDEGTIVAFSPDEKKMVYQDDSSGYPILYQLNLTTLKGKTFKGTKLFTKTVTVSGFAFTQANDLYFISNKSGPYNWNLYKYDFKKKTTSLISENVSYALRLRKFNNGLLFFVIQGSSSFPKFYNENTGKVGEFSGLAIDDSVGTVLNKDISFGGGMHGVLMTGTNFDKTSPHQLVIWLHGGPYRQTSLGFHSYASYAVYDLILNKLAENNVVVLKLDYRGSYGYGVKYEESILKNVGKGDVADVMTSLSSIKKKMSISDTYLIGNSYGGYLALRSIVAYPKSFSGAISINGVTDWGTLLTDMRDSIFNVDFSGIPNSKNTALYAQASILSRITNLTDQKMILIQSQSDKTIPPSQANLLYKALQSAGKNVAFYPYTGEDHTFTKIGDVEGVCKNVFDALFLPVNNNCNFQ